MIDVLLKLTDEQLDQEVISSFSSIRHTVYHAWSAEQLWLERLLLTEQPVWAAGTFTGTFQQACANWQSASENLLSFINRQFDDRAFGHVVQYYNLQKQSRKTPVSAILLQVFNHATYHRGQLVTMLRQIGITKLPSTDMVIFLS